MKSVRIRETQQETYKNINTTGLSVIINTKNPTSTTSIPRFEKILVKVILSRMGKDTILINENLRNILYLSEWDTPIFEYLKGITPPLSLNASNSQYLFPLKFDFGGIINLDGSDSLTVQVTLGDSTFDTAFIDENNSYLAFDIIEGVGLETYTPMIKSRVIEATQSNPSFDLGDNCMEILLANFDKNYFRTADAVINNIQVDSDKWSRNDSYEELISRNFGQFTSLVQSETRLQSFRLYSGYELDGVKINLSLNTANVNPSQNVILWYCHETNDHVVTKAGVKARKFGLKNNLKGQFNPSLVKQYS